MAPPPALSCPVDATDALAAVSVARAPKAVAIPDNIVKGIGLIIASTVLFSAGDVAAKMMTDVLPAVEVVWFRYVVFVLLALPLVVARRGNQAMQTARPVMQGLRGIAVVASSIFFILGLGHLQPAEATAITFIAPLFITALSIPLLGEKVDAHRWTAAAIGFVGVLLVVRPGSSAFQLAAMFPIGSAFAGAFIAIATRKMSAEQPETTLAWTAIIGLVGLTIVLPWFWQTPDMRMIGIGILTGIFSTAGHWLTIRAYQLAPASLLAPFSYVQLIFAGVMGYLAFGVVPGPWTFAGVAVIAASGLYTAQRERPQRA